MTTDPTKPHMTTSPTIGTQQARTALDALITQHRLPAPLYVDLSPHHLGVTAWARLASAEHVAPWAAALSVAVRAGHNTDTGAWTLDLDRAALAEGIDVYCYWDGSDA
jgi:hypothetical protein